MIGTRRWRREFTVGFFVWANRYLGEKQEQNRTAKAKALELNKSLLITKWLLSMPFCYVPNPIPIHLLCGFLLFWCVRDSPCFVMPLLTLLWVIFFIIIIFTQDSRLLLTPISLCSTIIITVRCNSSCRRWKYQKCHKIYLLSVWYTRKWLFQ